MNQRIQNLRKLFKKEKVDALLVTKPTNIRYLTGFIGLSPNEREVWVLVTKEQVYLLTDGRYIKIARNLKISKDTPGVARRSSPGVDRRKDNQLEILEIKPGKDALFLLYPLVRKLRLRRLGFEANNLTFSEYQKLKNPQGYKIKGYKITCDRRQKCNLGKPVPTKDLIENLRAIKEKEEIEKIKKAAQLTDRCFREIKKIIKPGLTESQIAWKIEKFIREKGARIAFPPIVAADQNSSLPHHRSCNYRLKRKSLVLIDLGAKIDGYCTDMTRVVFLGKPTTFQQKIYQIVRTAQEKALNFLNEAAQNLIYSISGRYSIRLKSNRKSLLAKEVDKVAREFIKKKDFGEIPHSLGHGVGLSAHEKPVLSPKSKDSLCPGMIFTVEPGVYLPQKFGIRIEDLVLLKKKGKIEILTKAAK